MIKTAEQPLLDEKPAVTGELPFGDHNSEAPLNNYSTSTGDKRYLSHEDVDHNDGKDAGVISEGVIHNYQEYPSPKTGVFSVETGEYKLPDGWLQKEEVKTIIGEMDDTYVYKLLDTGHGEYEGDKVVQHKYSLPVGIHKSRLIRWESNNQKQKPPPRSTHGKVAVKDRKKKKKKSRYAEVNSKWGGDWKTPMEKLKTHSDFGLNKHGVFMKPKRLFFYETKRIKFRLDFVPWKNKFQFGYEEAMPGTNEGCFWHSAGVSKKPHSRYSSIEAGYKHYREDFIRRLRKAHAHNSSLKFVPAEIKKLQKAFEEFEKKKLKRYIE